VGAHADRLGPVRIVEEPIDRFPRRDQVSGIVDKHSGLPVDDLILNSARTFSPLGWSGPLGLVAGGLVMLALSAVLGVS
jgi:hypothetical protein